MKNTKTDAHAPASIPQENLPDNSPETLPPQTGGQLSHVELARLWDIVIRAHYLALELGDTCTKSGLANAQLALSLSRFLSGWATDFGLELEQAEQKDGNKPPADSPSDDPA